MKKRVLTLMLAMLVCASTVLTLSGCGKHTFKTDWEKDATHHWHACEDADCTEISDKAEHTWDEGEETTFATDTADGVMTYTCTVCKQTRTEATTFNGLNITQYGEAVYEQTLRNVTVAIKIVSGGQTLESTLMLDGDCYDHKGNTLNGAVDTSDEDDYAAASLRSKYLFFAIEDDLTGINKLTHKDLIYDAASKTYSTAAEFTMTVVDNTDATVTTYKSIKMTFSGARVETVKAEFEITQDGFEPVTGTIELTLSTYGTTEVVIDSYDPDEDPDLGNDPYPEYPEDPEDY